MDKNKNRSDMIKAGRQRLEQYRQKKDGKGSSSQGKSSKKSGKSEKREARPAVASAAKKPTSISHAESHSVENSSASEVDVGVQDSEGEMTHGRVRQQPTANIEGMNKEGEKMPLGEDLSNVSEIQARGEQVADEANGLGSKELDRGNDRGGRPDENLSTKLAESENMVASLQLENSKFSGILASLQEERKQIEEENEQLINKYEEALMESDKHKCLVADLQVENAGLIKNVSSLTKEKDRLEVDKKRTAHEIEKLSSEFLVLQEQSSKEQGARLRVEADLKEAMMHLDQLTKENAYLTTNLDMHKATIEGIDELRTQLPSLAGNQVGYAEVRSMVSDGAVDEQRSSNNVPKQDTEVFPSLKENSLSDVHERGPTSELSEEEYLNYNSGFVVLKGRLEEAEKVLQKLEKEVFEMHSCSASLNKPGGNMAKPAVSELIKAFESKPPTDEPQERTEDRLVPDPYDLTREHAEELRSVLKQLVLDVDNAFLLFKGELEGRKAAVVALRELNVQFEALEEHSSTLEATSIELGVSYEALRHHVSEVENKNTDLEVLCESLKELDIGHRAENSGLVTKLSGSQSRISELESELLSLQYQSDEKVSRISELENELLKLQYQSDEKVSRINELESELLKLQYLSDEKVSKIGELESELHKMQYQSDEKVSRISELESELLKLQHQSDESVSRISDLESELLKLQQQSNGKVSRISELESGLLKLQYQSDEKVSKICDLESEVLKLQNQSDEKVSKIGELESELLKLQDQLDEKVSKIDELESELLKFQNQSDEKISKISELERELLKLQNQTDEKVSLLTTAQNETSERALQLEREWSSAVSQINEKLENFHEFTCMLFPMFVSDTVCNPTDIVGRVTASVDATAKVIEDAWERLQAAQIEFEVLCSSHGEVTERFDSLHRSSEINTGILHRLHGELKNLVIASCGLLEESEIKMLNENLLYPVDFSHFKVLLEHLRSSLDERLQLLSVNNKLRSEMKDSKEKFLDLDAINELVEDVVNVIKLEETGFRSGEPPILHLKILVPLLVRKYKEADEKLGLSLKQYEDKVMELAEMEERVQQFSMLNLQQDNEILIIKESLRQAEEALASVSSKLQEKETELEQSEQRVSSIREKLSIAVAKGKGLVVQRDNLKQSLAETTNELERCSEALQITEDRLREAEAKLKTCSEAGERVEALESELSYIRHSATALRESFLLKDSVLQRIEEILEDLDLPENFHSRGIIEKIEWLARSVAGSSNLADWDQKSSVEGGSYSEAGYSTTDAWKEDVQVSSSSGDDLRRRFEDLQGKFYGLAEQNEMLEQSLMERNNLVQRWEELLNRVDMPLHLRSMEPVDRVQWLGAALSEAHNDRNSLLEKVDKLENYIDSTTAELDDSKRQIVDLKAELQENFYEKKRISDILETLIDNQDKLSAKIVLLGVENERLQDEATYLQERLTQKQGIEEHMSSINGDIKRMQELIIDAVHDPGINDIASDDGNTACLEALLRTLIEGYTTISSVKDVPLDAVADEDVSIEYSARSAEAMKPEDPALSAIKKELEETLDELRNVKEERDSYLEKQQSLVHEVETLNRKVLELQELFSQEEQKATSLREKLNVAVRKGKSLVQHRDSLKRTIEEMNTELERLKSDLGHHVKALADYEQKVKTLSSYPERVEVVESENVFLRDRLSETEHYLQENGHTLNSFLHTLNDIDVGGGMNITDPVKKLEQLGILHLELHASVASSEQEAAKSKRAAELLLAELNEVQDRNDGLQEDLEKAVSELAELSRQRNEAEAAKADALSRLDKLATTYDAERKNHLLQLMPLKTGIEQFKRGFFDFSDQLDNVFSKNLEYLHGLEFAVESCLKPSIPTAVFSAPIIAASGSFSQIKENQQFMESWQNSYGQDLYDDNVVTEISSNMGHHLQEIMTAIISLNEKLHSYSTSLHQKSGSLSQGMEIVYREVTSHRESFEAMKKNIVHLESNLREKDSEISVLRRTLSLLYDTCAGSVMEIETRKAETNGNDSVDGLHPEPSADGGLDLTGHTNMLSEAKNMAEKLRMMVKEFASTNAKLLEGSQMEMKITIANLQKELQEKDIQKERICGELVSQIKEAEAAANSYSLDLQSARNHLQQLENQVKMMEKEQNLSEQRVKELQDQQAMSAELQDNIRSLTTALAGKDQEIESLMQALDEEEAQMEDLTKKFKNLEKVVRQKNLELENLEASRGKVMKKLSVTVGKFDELHDLSESLLTEVENLQSQLQERDAEISFLRQEVTRCTNDVLVASQTSSKTSIDEIQDFLTWLDTSVSVVGVHDVNLGHINSSEVHEQKEILQKKITSVLSELEDLRVAAQGKDALLQVEKSKVEELAHKKEMLEKLLHDRENQYGLLEDIQNTGRAVTSTSEIVEVEPMINKWTVSGTSTAPQVRSLRKVNNDQVAIPIDADADSSSRIADEDDDKVHGFKSLTTSRIVPRFTRPVTDMIDGLWVSCDRALMRQPALRLGIIIYWGILHALLATFVV